MAISRKEYERPMAERRKAILEMGARGVSAGVIARTVGISSGSVRRILESDDPEEAGRRHDDRLRELFEDGATVKEIVAELGMSSPRIYARAAELGLRRPGGGISDADLVASALKSFELLTMFYSIPPSIPEPEEVEE